MLKLQAAEEINQRDAFPQALLIGKDHILIAKEGLLEACQTALLELKKLEVFALEDDLLCCLLIRVVLGLLSAPLCSILSHQRLDKGINNLLLLTKDFGITNTLLALE